MLLIGIVKKNAIMMIDFALEAQREHGKPPEEAIYQASLLRFRPIMMTTMASICLAACRWRSPRASGTELRRPLGISIVGGLNPRPTPTLATPVIYLAFDRLAARFGYRETVPSARPAEGHA